MITFCLLEAGIIAQQERNEASLFFLISPDGRAREILHQRQLGYRLAGPLRVGGSGVSLRAHERRRGDTRHWAPSAGSHRHGTHHPPTRFSLCAPSANKRAPRAHRCVTRAERRALCDPLGPIAGKKSFDARLTISLSWGSVTEKGVTVALLNRRPPGMIALVSFLFTIVTCVFRYAIRVINYLRLLRLCSERRTRLSTMNTGCRASCRTIKRMPWTRTYPMPVSWCKRLDRRLNRRR